MKTIEQIAAEILVECGYAERIVEMAMGGVMLDMTGWSSDYEGIDPFSDTIEGRRQADAIEDWLCSRYELIPDSVWEQSQKHSTLTTTRHQWRLDRIKWCLEQLRDEA